MPGDDTALHNLRWARLMVDELVRCGVCGFVISPGSRSTPLTLAVAEHTRARRRIHYDERGAAFFALGWAKATGRPAVLICTSGSAAANYYPAIVEAAQSGVPLIALTADRPAELIDCGANQAIDQNRMFGAYVRWYAGLPAPDDAPARYVVTTVDQAVHRAMTSPVGPVHLNCPYREPFLPSTPDADDGAQAPLRAGDEAYTRYTAAKPAVGADDLGACVAVLQGASRGWLVVGGLRAHDDATAVTRLAAALGWPLFPDVASGLRLRGDVPGGVAYFDTLLTAGVPESMRPDCVLHVGGAVTSKALLQCVDAWDAPLIHVSDDPGRRDPTHRVSLRITAALSMFCDGVSNAIVKREESDWLRNWRKLDVLADEAVEVWCGEQTAITEIGVARVVSRHAPADSVIVVGNSMPVRDFDRYAATDGAGAFVYASRGASGIDGAIATAAGVAEAGSGPVSLVLGDLALLHDLNSLALLRDSGTPVAIVVVNNDGGGIFSFLPVASYSPHFERYFGTPHGMNFEHAARQFGLPYVRPATPSDFEEAYTTATGRPGATLLEVVTERDTNRAAHRALQSRIAAVSTRGPAA